MGKSSSMPIYEYLCLGCKLQFEYLVRGSEAARCPRCNRKHLKKMVSGFAFTSRDARGNTTASSSSCSGCASHNCATCSQ